MKALLIVVFGIELGIQLLVDCLGIAGNVSPEWHRELLCHFTAQDIAAGQAYDIAGVPAGMALRIVAGALVLVLLFSGLGTWLEDRCGRVARGHPFPAAVLYILAVYTAFRLLLLPFAFYFGFILEHRFGFSTMSPSFWFMTQLKSFALLGVILAACGPVALAIIRRFRRTWFVLVPLAGLLFGLGLEILYPVIVLPIFHESGALPEGPLREKIVGLTDRAGIPVRHISVIDESRYSTHTNAYFIGWGGYRRIYLYDTLMQRHTDEEIVSILAHEIGHWRHDHVTKGLLAGFVLSVLGFLFMHRLYSFLRARGAIHLRELHAPSTLAYYLYAYLLLSFFTGMIQAPLSRHFEREADLASLELTGDRAAFIGTEVKMARDNRQRLDPHPAKVFLRFSHPPTLERIRMAEGWHGAAARP